MPLLRGAQGGKVQGMRVSPGPGESRWWRPSNAGSPRGAQPRAPSPVRRPASHHAAHTAFPALLSWPGENPSRGPSGAGRARGAQPRAATAGRWSTIRPEAHTGHFSYLVYLVAVHSQTLPSMSYSPQGLGFFSPTGCVVPSEFALYHA
jgi:hypothetical protein